MNIAYLTQITNLEISDKNPLIYIRDYDSNSDFEEAIKSHMLPNELLEWARLEKMPVDALDQFIEKRVALIIDELKRIMSGTDFEVLDTKERANNSLLNPER